jgi:hypothetical protein
MFLPLTQIGRMPCSSHGHLISGLYEADALSGSEYGSIAMGEMLYAFSGYSRSSCRVAEQRLVADARQLAPVIEVRAQTQLEVKF